MLGVFAIGCHASTPGAAHPDGAFGDANSVGQDVVNREDASGSQHSDVPALAACSGDAGSASKGKTESCTCDSECRSGFCANGVCCTSACAEGCKACNLPSSLGDCSFIPAGVKPVQASFCTASTPSTCGQDGTCDGKGACRKFVAGIACEPGTCEGDGVSGAKACDGNGNCSQSISTPCGNYSCDSASSQCYEECTTNAQCAAGQQCALQSCGMKLNGFDCKADSDCASGHCADKKCCNQACNGACLSCNQPGSIGRCKFVDSGIPHPACKATSASTCATTGLCDGAGACALYPENTPCVAASCAGSVLLNSPRVCDGQGTCRPAQLRDCSPYLCTAGDCNGSCVSDADCEPGHQCVTTTVRGMTTGRCGQKKNGQSCSDPSDCESSQCVDGVCCESACAGPCRSCDLPGSPGQCVNIASGAADPRQSCQDNGKPSCGTNGLCDGTGACQKYAPGTVCGSETCQSGAYTPAATCNQSGQCVASPSLTCNPFTCNGSSCYKSCSADSQCVTGNFCLNGSCGRKGPGAECSAGSECQSGHCAQGVCCNSECADACMACNLPTTLGLCTSVADGAPDPQEKCQATAQTSCGTTGLCKTGTCAFFAKGLNCKDPACSTASSETPASTCDGAGACLTPAPLSCGAFICSSAACETTCKTDADCVAPSTCIKSSCGLKPAGAACTATPQCETGLFCTEGVCCDTDCSDAATGGLCMSCKVAGKVGTCSPVPLGGNDPKKLCIATDPLGVATDPLKACTNNGTCDGAGACSPWPATTGCRLASCKASIYTEAANCDGIGNCPAAKTGSCNSYQCDATATSCLIKCAKNQDCTGGLNCNQTNNQCGSKLGLGVVCTIDPDCDSGHCVDGVCCGVAACAALDQCHVAGTCSAGTGKCSNPSAADGTACNDANACTRADGCKAGVCTGSNPVGCTASDQCHGVGTCDPSTGSCSNPTKSDGTTCNDGNACTQTDTCHSGSCTGGNPIVCAASDQCHVAGTCNTSTGQCSNPNAGDGTTCNDQNACTQTDKCQAGVCTGSNPVVCAASDQCHVAGTCNTSTGQCSNPNASDGTTCNDQNACTQTDKCQAGVCTGSNPVVCAASDQCHVAGSCDASTGQCSNPNANDGTICNDGNPCTQTDKCETGVCAGSSPIVCTASDSCHVAGTCNPGTGQCSNPNASDGTTCSDGNGCTQIDQCKAGVCTGSNPVVCVASDQCHVVGTCNPGTGQCSNPSANDGTTCGDGNACTQTDTCQAGVCTGSNPVVCAASDQCHVVGTCDPGTGQCSNPIADDGTTCSDGDMCTQTDTCLAGVCTGHNPVVCAASDQCHVVGTCEPGTGQCSNPSANDGTTCSDGDNCTQTDTCQAGVCTGANPVACAALDQCHVLGTCNSATGICSNPVGNTGNTCSDSPADVCCQDNVCVAAGVGTCQ